MSEEQTPENQAQPDAEQESAQIQDFSSVKASQAALSGNYSFDELFADGDTIDDSDTNHWSVPWSDLMMVMFVLFAALLTAQALERKVPELVEQPVPNIEIEKEKVVRDTLGTSNLSFEPLMRVNVFERSRQAVREANIQNVEIAIMEDQ